MKIYIDENIPFATEFFSSLGELAFVNARELTNDQVRAADLLIVRSVGRVDASLLHGSRVQFVGTCTAGFDHLDTEYLQANHIAWANAPGCNAQSVVEYVLSSLSSLDIDWQRRRFGVIGCGHVGGLLLDKLTSLGVMCCGYDPFLDTEQDPLLTSWEEVANADIICLHAPLTREGPFPTHHLIAKNFLRKLPPNAILISAGRGAVVDNTALLSVLQQRDDLQVVLDVWENEPTISFPLLEHAVIATPHIAGHSFEGKVEGTQIIYNRVCKFLGVKPELDWRRFDHADRRVIACNSDSKHALSEVILQAYDVRRDHQRFVDELGRRGAQQMQKIFDAQRKNYPIRREFSHCEVKFVSKIKKPNLALRQQLLSLGFVVSNESKIL